MNETYVRDRLRDTFKAYGYRVDVQTDTVICHRCHTKIVPPRGKPDMTILHPVTGRGFYIEVKVIRSGDTSFPFSRIEEHQRRILTASGKMAYLGLGEIVRPVDRKQDQLFSLWLLPWSRWRAIEERYQSFYHRKSISRFDIRDLATEFALSRKPGFHYPKPLGKPTWLLSIHHPVFPWTRV